MATTNVGDKIYVRTVNDVYGILFSNQIAATSVPTAFNSVSGTYALPLASGTEWISPGSDLTINGNYAGTTVATIPGPIFKSGNVIEQTKGGPQTFVFTSTLPTLQD